MHEERLGALPNCFCPSNGGSAGVEPAALTNGAATLSSTGATASAIATDVAAAVGTLTAATALQAPVWIMSRACATYLALLALQGATGFAGMNTPAPMLAGIPVLISSGPGTGNLVLLEASLVTLAVDEVIRLDVSQQASVQMVDAPSAGAAAMVPLWSNDMTGFRAEISANWALAVSGAAVVITGASYA
jgi:hypothetical protein